ncbi:hypothetical protein JCM9279_007368 [Rhodotorula babjevae]
MRIDRQHRRYPPPATPTPVSTAKTMQDIQDTILQLTRIVSSLTTEVESLYVRVGRLEQAQARAQYQHAPVTVDVCDERVPHASAAASALEQVAPDALGPRPPSSIISTHPALPVPPSSSCAYDAPPSYSPTHLAPSSTGTGAAEDDWLLVEDRSSMPAPPSPSRAPSPAFSLFGGASDGADKGSEDEALEQDEEEEEEEQRTDRRPAPIATMRYGVVVLGRSMYVRGLSESVAVKVEADERRGAENEAEEPEEESALERIE